MKDGSRTQYANSQVRFLQWLSANYPDVLTAAFLSRVFGGHDREGGMLEGGMLEDKWKRKMKEMLTDSFDKNVPPVHFEKLTVTMFLQFISSLTTGFESANGFRSAVTSLFKDYEQAVPDDWESKVSACFQGLRRTLAERKANGDGTLKERGKRALPFDLFCEIARCFFASSDSRTGLFALSFSLLAWNLMSRAKNVTSINYADLDWDGDSLTVMFNVMKTDQEGARKYARHVFSNPLKPEIDVLLALGVYLMTKETVEEETKLFPGGTQYQHFSKVLQSMFHVNREKFSRWMKEGEDANFIGTHSFRKGSATYACSGSTVGAHISAISNRCGWKQPGVQDTYLKYDNAGDQLVGRIVAGLPVNAVEFAFMPPSFVNSAEVDLLVKDAVRRCFGEVLVSKVKFRVLSHCLAAVVHHNKWLKDFLPKGSPLWLSALFADHALLTRLEAAVVCRLPLPADDVQPSGLPPHIPLLLSSLDVSKKIDRFHGILGDNAAIIVNGVLEGLDSRQVNVELTPTGIRNQMVAVLEGFGFKQKSNADAVPGEPAEVRNQQPVLTFFCWGERLDRLLPQDFKVPKSNVRDMWILYIAGSATSGFPPLKYVGAEHVCDKNTKKRFHEFKGLMKTIEARVTEKGKWRDDRTVEAALEMYEAGKDAVQIGAKSQKARERRVGMLSWRTVWNEVSQKRRGNQRKKQKHLHGRESCSEGDSDDDSAEYRNIDNIVEPKTPLRRTARRSTALIIHDTEDHSEEDEDDVQLEAEIHSKPSRKRYKC